MIVLPLETGSCSCCQQFLYHASKGSGRIIALQLCHPHSCMAAQAQETARYVLQKRSLDIMRSCHRTFFSSAFHVLVSTEDTGTDHLTAPVQKVSPIVNIHSFRFAAALVRFRCPLKKVACTSDWTVTKVHPSVESLQKCPVSSEPQRWEGMYKQKGLLTR